MEPLLCSEGHPRATTHPSRLDRQAVSAEHGEGGIPVIPEVSLESDSESDVSEDSDVFSGRWGSCAISMGVSLYSGLLQGGGRHSSGGQTPILDGLLWTIFSPLLAPSVWSWESLKATARKHFPAPHGTCVGAGILHTVATAAPRYNGWTPTCHRKAPKRLLNNQGALGAGALCCLTFVPVEHLGTEGGWEVPSAQPAHASWCALSSLGLLRSPLPQCPHLGSLMELLSCSEGSKATGGGGGRVLSPRRLTIWQTHRCTSGCMDYGY